jgi:thioredoxin reductase (NADPH)
MADVAIVGGGTAGLSAALFTAKNGLDTVVFDTDESWMHKAHLFNYLGIRSISGDEFLTTARGQVQDRGASLHMNEEVSEVEQTDGGFAIETEDSEYEATYVVLATGMDRSIAEALGCAFDGDVVDVTLRMETSVENCFATGAMVRADEWQAAIAGGDGAAAALSILSAEKGERFHDFDTPADVPTLGSE